MKKPYVYRFFIQTIVIIAITTILTTGCDRFRDEHQIAATFTEFMNALQERRFDDIDSLIHSSSKFMDQKNTPALRKAAWEVQLLRLSMIGGYMEPQTVAPVDETGIRKLTVELTPHSKQLATLELEVPFAVDKGKWKMLLPVEGLDLVPIDFSQLRPEFGPYKNQDGNVSFDLKVEHVDGFSQDQWLKLIRDKKKEAEKKNKKETVPEKKDVTPKTDG